MTALASPLLRPAECQPPEVAEQAPAAKAPVGGCLTKAGRAALAGLALCTATGLLWTCRAGRGPWARAGALTGIGWPADTSGPTDLAVEHPGKDCLPHCGGAGYCDWCGPGNRCCQENDPHAPPECPRTGFTQSLHHECRAPFTESTAYDAEWLQCVTDTGGTCNIWRCNAERGPTVCERVAAFFHYCKCQEGYCSDLAGRCIKQENSPVAVSVRFRNAQWPDYFLYVSGDYAMVSDGILESDDSAKFNVYMLPSNSNRPNRLMMGSVKYPSYVVTTETVQHCYHDTDPDDTRPTQCITRWLVGAERVSRMTMRHVIRMLSVDWEEPAVMIEALAYPGRFWYVPYGSWNVRARFGDPGPQGYWIPDPPLPDSLHLPQIAPIMVAANLTANL
uniref:Uncharacterized protein n=1 Tax=Alexandrium monilatum TaxID=311494 RepID=A0A7S4VHL8_9DINO